MSKAINNAQVIYSSGYCQFAGFSFRNAIKEVSVTGKFSEDQASSPYPFNKVSKESSVSKSYNLWISNQSILTSMVAMLHIVLVFSSWICFDGERLWKKEDKKVGILEVKEKIMDVAWYCCCLIFQ